MEVATGPGPAGGGVAASAAGPGGRGGRAGRCFRTAEVIVLPRASSAEGIAAGRGPTFYAGDLFRGDIRPGTAELFIDAPDTSVINDVAVTKRGAWFTDSLQAQLYFVPVSRAGIPKPFRTLELSGPAGRPSEQPSLDRVNDLHAWRLMVLARGLAPVARWSAG